MEKSSLHHLDYGCDNTGLFEVIIRDGYVKKYPFFDDKGAWVQTLWNFSADYLPNLVNQVIVASCPGYFINSIYFVETAEYVFYEVKLVSGEKEVAMKITSEGFVLQ